MTTNIREIGFESYLEQKLINLHKYLKRTAKDYDKNLCLDTELVLQFIRTAQSDTWESLAEQYGDQTEEKVLSRLADELRERGTLDVLRKGIKDRGAHINLAYFAPATAMNEETKKLHESNIYSVMRQVKYSERSEKSIDMVLFVNGIPLFTIELKNQLTGQNVDHGKRQYRVDRDPREALLAFKRCLVHFAIDTEEVYMTTKLTGLSTFFLPFNQGNQNGAGNPVRTDGEYKTAYMWEDIFSPDSVMEIVGEFMHLERLEKRDAKGRLQVTENLIFPRYHQRDTVKRLIAHTKKQGAGQKYLIQHSAGSGKSNTIAWTAHRLSELHSEEDNKIFDSVIVVTDRRVLDRQLQYTIDQFAQVPGVVRPITEGSAELKDALEGGDKIIVTTIQKFPFVVEAIEKLSGKKYAIIIDEAHSSQTGESARTMRKVLSIDNTGDEALDEALREEAVKEETTEDQIVKDMRARKTDTEHISFFAFTATPKQKTLEIFGIQNSLDGKFYPFSLYSMKQAIEEGFILDVLKNYTTYKTYFSLLKKVANDPEYSKRDARRVMVSYVDRHEHSIDKKVEAMMDHFMTIGVHAIDGQGKAMVVTKSRLHAVRFKQAFDRYIAEHRIPYGALVAFSGKIQDQGIEYTESSMNGVPESHTVFEFKKESNKFLIVAEKYQTGFDEPLLATMYVDKILSGVGAVQTLSRLNRQCSRKDETFVLDFVNDTDDIKKAFQTYYTTTVLSEATDPNILHDLERDILNYRIFSEHEIAMCIEDMYRSAPPSVINNYLDQVVPKYEALLPEEKEELRSKLSDYIRKYAFLSQIITFEDTMLEKMYQYVRMLRKKLPRDGKILPLELLEGVDIHSLKVVKKGSGAIELEDVLGELEPMSSNGRMDIEDEREFLSRIIKDVNEKFGTEFTSNDRVILNTLSGALAENESLQGAIQNNSKEDAKLKFEGMFQDKFIGMVNNHFELYKKLDNNPDLKTYVRDRLFDFLHRKLKKKV